MSAGARRTQPAPKKVLVIDDDDDFLVLAREVLAHPEVRVLATKNGVEGVAMAREHLPDAVVIDIHMPIMDGLEVFRVLKDTAGTRSCKFILVSAVAVQGALKLARDVGAHATLRKPFKPMHLRRAVLGALGIDQPERRRKGMAWSADNPPPELRDDPQFRTGKGWLR